METLGFFASPVCRVDLGGMERCDTVAMMIDICTTILLPKKVNLIVSGHLINASKSVTNKAIVACESESNATC